jgi:hypothetical protein
MNRECIRLRYAMARQAAKKTLNKSADYTDYADFGFELRRAGRNERKLLS